MRLRPSWAARSISLETNLHETDDSRLPKPMYDRPSGTKTIPQNPKPAEQSEQDRRLTSGHSRLLPALPNLRLPCSGHSNNAKDGKLSFFPAESLRWNHLAHTAMEPGSSSQWYERTSTHVIGMLVLLMIAVALVEAYEKLAKCCGKNQCSGSRRRKSRKREAQMGSLVRGTEHIEAHSHALLDPEKGLVELQSMTPLERIEEGEEEDHNVKNPDFWIVGAGSV